MNLTSNYYSPSGIIHMEKLVNTVQLLSLAQNIEEVMRIVRTVARELTGADGATFVLREDNLCYYADEDAIRPLWKGSKFPMHSCLSGWVMLNRKPAIVPDIFSDDRIPTSVYEPTFVRSVLMVPIRTIKPLGAIGNYWASKHEPTLEEITTLQSLADITAVSIEIIDVRNNLEFKVGERTRELMESLQREKELNKLKSNFVAMASHELKTPLSTILSSISLSERYLEIGEKEKRQKHIDRIKSSIQNMRETLDDFLIVEKLESEKSSVKWEEFELIPFLVEINSCFEGILKKGQRIELDMVGNSNVFADKRILRNVMLNLVSNALKYSENKVEVRIENMEGFLQIQVEDFGIGIPVQQQANLFGRFFRASNVNDVKGTGLGLSIVKHYLEQLGGSISFTSEEGEGSTFTIRIPQKDTKSSVRERN